jgi:hypothetical protein
MERAFIVGLRTVIAIFMAEIFIFRTVMAEIFVFRVIMASGMVNSDKFGWHR